MASFSKAPTGMIDAAAKHIRDILTLAIGHGGQSAVVVYDGRSELSVLLTEAYRRCLPAARFLDFDAHPAAAVLDALAPLLPSDLVVLIQSGNFRLEAFRLRVELFKRGLKVIEHPHLVRMRGAEAAWYVDALAYDPAYYRGVGSALKARIDGAASATVFSGSRNDGVGGAARISGVPSDGEALVFSSRFEPAKLNVGDYRGMKNIGGQFPIGEVFTEARDLEAVNGRIRIFAFADTTFMVNRPERPITLIVTAGRVAGAVDSIPEFEKVLANIRADEGEVWVRELGFGMNRAFTPHRMVSDIGTVERMCGIHLSLGAKHAVYQKADFRRRDGRHHVDVFAVTESVRLDDVEVFRDGALTLPPLS
jgi:aminopeptidase